MILIYFLRAMSSVQARASPVSFTEIIEATLFKMYSSIYILDEPDCRLPIKVADESSLQLVKTNETKFEKCTRNINHKCTR